MPRTEKQKRGPNPVNRSTYQKVVEENKRLKKDIYILCSDEFTSIPEDPERFSVKFKWREAFKKEKDFWASIGEVIKMAEEVAYNRRSMIYCGDTCRDAGVCLHPESDCHPQVDQDNTGVGV